MTMTISEATQTLAQLQRELHAYRHAVGVIRLDSLTVAPSGSARGRGETLQFLASKSYDLLVNPDTARLLYFLRDHEDELTAHQAREVQLLLEEYENISKVPAGEYAAYRALINQTESVWHEAKRTNDYPLFAPYLGQVVETMRRFAGYYAPGKDPMDVWLNQNERGLSREKLDPFFTELREKIGPILHHVARQPQIDDGFLFQSYPIYRQRELADYLMELLCIDRQYCNIGETEHPFTTRFNKHDVRITTKYQERSFAPALFSVIHESGHALYELGLDDEHTNTFLDGGASSSIHESQSRLFENMVGRSQAFLSLIFPKLQELFPSQLGGVTAEALYRAVNKSQPSPIRIEADELTYPFHIMVRYEIEKAMMAGEVSMEKLPALWAEKMEQYLGIQVPDDAHGILQDSHWSGGKIGYFPSYALGSAYAAQIMARMRFDLDPQQVIASGDLSPIVGWLRERVHRYGMLLDPDDVILNCCGAPFDPAYYTDYLADKYTKLYQL